MTGNMLRKTALVLVLAAALGATIACAPAQPGTYKTPDEAVRTIADFAGTGDTKKAAEIFGPSALDLLQSGDDVADPEDELLVKRLILEKVAFEDQGAELKVASLGNDGWPFPIPLVLENGRWRFDVEAGRKEIENRRIGRNELLTLTTLHEYVDAQREYFAEGRDGNPPAYAQKILSTESRHDGLYWPAAEGKPESPLGPQAAAAAKEGYRRSDVGPFPFHGYYYRTLTAQGRSAPAGAKSYVNAKGLMTGGFALLAWPAKYGS